jgi:hypothetical protein
MADSVMRLELVRLDGGTQSRLDLSQDRIADYADNISTLPPVLVYFDGTDNWLVDNGVRSGFFLEESWQ